MGPTYALVALALSSAFPAASYAASFDPRRQVQRYAEYEDPDVSQQVVSISEDDEVTEFPITKRQNERESELFSQQFQGAGRENGGQLVDQEIHKMEEELETKPWYYRLAQSVKRQVILLAKTWLVAALGGNK